MLDTVLTSTSTSSKQCQYQRQHQRQYQRQHQQNNVKLPWQRNVYSNWNSVCRVRVVHQQLWSDVRRNEPEQFGQQHEADEGYAADGDDGTCQGRLCQIFRYLPVDVQPLEVERHRDCRNSTSIQTEMKLPNEVFIILYSCFVDS